MNKENIYGVFELVSIQTYENGNQTSDKAKSGLFTFMRNDFLSVVSGSDEWVMAYTGSFDIVEDVLLIKVMSCVVREMEATTIKRRIVKLNEKDLILESLGSDGKRSLITWKKMASL